MTRSIVFLRRSDITEMIEMSLWLEGYSCLFAHDLTESGEIAIIDLESLGVFGEADTLEVAHRMVRQFPLLFLTTNKKVATFLQQEGHAVLMKPFRIRELVTWVREQHPETLSI